jgi:hypothetical protein
MNPTASIQWPRLHKVIGALLWELGWKNRLIVPVLLLGFLLGAGLAFALDRAEPDVWWGNYARGTGFIAFTASILLAFAPFTLMESHGSWRMNSVITRWSVLPARTCCLVAVPLAIAWAVLALVVWAWAPVLERLFHGIDSFYMLAVYLTGAVAAQALAWAIPRKPSQFWTVAALLFLTLVLGSIVPQERAGWQDARLRTLAMLGGASVGFALLALWAAQRNRCGDWPGEVPFTKLWSGFRRVKPVGRVFRNRTAALLWSEVLPGCRAFAVSWLVLGLILAAWGCGIWWLRRPDVPIHWPLVAVGMLIEGLPNLGVPWLMAWGLFLGCEAGMGFQTKLSGFRSTRPLTAGMLAGTRMTSMALSWLVAWAPLLIAQHLLFLAPLTSDEALLFSGQAIPFTLGRMAFSASVMIAALPVLLWGRLEGFPTLLLASLIAWAWSCALAGFAFQKEASDWVGWALAAYLGLKLAVAAWSFRRSLRSGWITWRFPAVLTGGWLAVVAAMLWLWSPWLSWSLPGVLAPAAMIPLARLAACPMAMAANRHR